MTDGPRTTSAGNEACLRGPLDPLRTSRLFRMLWIAQVISFFGTWMQAVGAQWYFVAYSPLLVSLVPAASTLSTALFVLPGGVLADRFSRRSLLLLAFGAQTALLAGLTVFSVTDALGPISLLAITFSIGAAGAFAGPAYQAVQTESVRRSQLPQAATLTIVSSNLGKTVGPALAGLLISMSGPALVFGLDTLCFLLATCVLVPLNLGRADHGGESLWSSFLAAARQVRANRVATRALLWAGVVLSLNAALWALLPAFAHDQLRLGAAGYGGLVALVGVGAVLGALLLPRVRVNASHNQLFAASAATCGVSAVVVALSNTAITCVTLVACGFAYVSIFAELNATMQLCLPAVIRARGLSFFHLTVNGAIGVGSTLAGVLAEVTSTQLSMLAFGCGLTVAAGLFILAPFHTLTVRASDMTAV